MRLIANGDHYREVVRRIAGARESVWIATANVKDMHVEIDGRFRSVTALFSRLAARGVEVRLLHAARPSRFFRASFSGGAELRVCPRVHFKAVIVDGAWLYFGSANLTGAGLGAKGAGRRNFELGVATEEFDAIDRASALFGAVWSGAECASCKVRRTCPSPLDGEAPRGRRAGRIEPPPFIRLGRARRLR